MEGQHLILFCHTWPMVAYCPTSKKKQSTLVLMDEDDTDSNENPSQVRLIISIDIMGF